MTYFGNLFTSIPRGKDGSCYGKGINTDMRDTEMLLKEGIAVLDELIQGPVPKNHHSVRYLNMASAMFGIQYDLRKDGRLEVVEGQARLTQAKGYMENAKNLLLDPRTESARWKLECGDKDLIWASTLGDMGVKKSQKNPDPEESLPKAVAERSGDEEIAKYQGLFYSAYWQPFSLRSSTKWKTTLYLLPATPESTKSGFCGTDEAAVTFSSAKKMGAKDYLVLCDSYFEEKSLAWAHRHVKDAESLDYFAVKAGTLVHELMHMANPDVVIDEDVRTATGRLVPAQRWKRCKELAESVDDQKTVTNAETYRLFTLGVMLVEGDWWPEGYKENVYGCE
ncbi:hypothetical protein N7474_008467 [Penicillium riverlandense]|uniref:uncharacterized protein n=1 Tax=Penicillium riverlandense TaxID=1903569 RepID=UPI0025490331|nr:uncharacterized protein N7474_008467 [Penicillium riverlandense]KAJ5812166.1 hypothetical protein N7474_008467 [Penicillium riverlandense]